MAPNIKLCQIVHPVKTAHLAPLKFNDEDACIYACIRQPSLQAATIYFFLDCFCTNLAQKWAKWSFKAILLTLSHKIVHRNVRFVFHNACHEIKKILNGWVLRNLAFDWVLMLNHRTLWMLQCMAVRLKAILQWETWIALRRPHFQCNEVITDAVTSQSI